MKQIIYNNKKYIQVKANEKIKKGALHSLDRINFFPIANDSTIGQTPKDFSSNRTFYNKIEE